ncbi:glycosyl hydrolase 43 family protein [Paludisphaera rhizosphaerae]|uniref:glycosyl hydrolase 43 family protein n=1 Tax=Paludisphaera rhizosphaerae TaxID=2711216 RepID=UPI0013EA576A|nr:glycosyl hydrolase 43 family protein [Paludisphaera rhizosphaerae]
MTQETNEEASVSGEGRLRVGLILSGAVQPRWRRKLIKSLVDSPDCTLAARVVSVVPPAESARQGLFGLYCELDRRRFGGGARAVEPVDASDLLAHVPVVEPEALRELKLDVLLCLAPESTAAFAVDAARFGVWAIRLDGAESESPTAAAARAVLGGSPTASASLVRLDGGPILEARLKTDRLSTHRHLDHLANVAAEFVPRALARLRSEGRLPSPADSPSQPPTISEPPAAAETTRLATAFGGRLAAEGLRRAWRRDQWVLAYSMNGTWSGGLPDLSSLRLLYPPADRFWADPFPARIDGRNYIYFEDYPYSTRRGVISVLEIDDQGQAGPSRLALETDFHLSYPVILPWEGAIYMIPETSQNGRVELYRCEGAPDRWVFDRVLIPDVRAADSTLVEHGGRWWLFACIPAEGAHNDVEELHLFHAPSPMGPWRPHRCNPVKSDVSSARPAGGLYQVDGVWHRPAQDCTFGYGHAMVVNRIVRWDVDGYEEVEAGRIEPDWAPGLDRTHTFNALGSFFTADARISRPRLGGAG